MEDLQPKPTPPTPQPAPSAAAPPVVDTAQEEARTIRYAIGKLSDFLQWFALVLECSLLIRFVLMLIGANKTNPFVAFIYALTDIVLLPFATIVPSTPDPTQKFVFEWSTLIAMAIYALVFWAVRRFLQILATEGPAS